MKIYWIKAQAPLRVLALARHLQMEFEPVELDLTGGEMEKPEFTRLNPNQMAPVLVEDDGRVITESLAIMAHLALKARSDLWPAQNGKEQVEILKWIGWGQHWSDAVAPFYFEHIVKWTFAKAPPDLKRLEGKADELIPWARVLDQHLEGREFVACGRLTIADFHLASMARYWRESKMPFSGFPGILSWLDRLMKYPAWREPWPKE